VVGSASAPSTSSSSSSTLEDLQQLKQQLRESLQGIDRGIFGTQVGHLQLCDRLDRTMCRVSCNNNTRRLCLQCTPR
jgi:hypothetical protein